MTATPQFTLAPYSIAEIGAAGVGSISVKVDGFWSCDSARLYVKRCCSVRDDGTRPAQWTCEVNHSSGGRDTKEVADHLEAETNFAFALLQLVAVGRAFLLQSDVLEWHYQAQCAKDAAAEVEEESAAAERAAADPPLGEIAAEALIEKACAEALTSRHEEVAIMAVKRGEMRPNAAHTMLFNATRLGRVTIRLSSRVITRRAAVEALKEHSHRSALKEQS